MCSCFFGGGGRSFVLVELGSNTDGSLWILGYDRSVFVTSQSIVVID